jgi:hypothetical protein
MLERLKRKTFARSIQVVKANGTIRVTPSWYTEERPIQMSGLALIAKEEDCSLVEFVNAVEESLASVRNITFDEARRINEDARRAESAELTDVSFDNKRLGCGFSITRATVTWVYQYRYEYRGVLSTGPALRIFDDPNDPEAIRFLYEQVMACECSPKKKLPNPPPD